jgi:hypothetical protein
LIGKWKGKGCGTYPAIKPFEYAEEVEFSNDGIPFINYKYEPVLHISSTFETVLHVKVSIDYINPGTWLPLGFIRVIITKKMRHLPLPLIFSILSSFFALGLQKKRQQTLENLHYPLNPKY